MVSLTKSCYCSSWVSWVSSAVETRPAFWSHCLRNQWYQTGRVWLPDSPGRGFYNLQKHKVKLSCCVMSEWGIQIPGPGARTHRADLTLCPAQGSCTEPPARWVPPSASPYRQMTRQLTPNNTNQTQNTSLLSTASSAHETLPPTGNVCSSSAPLKESWVTAATAPPGGLEENTCNHFICSVPS